MTLWEVGEPREEPCLTKTSRAAERAGDLATYKRKRRFDRTPEPPAERAGARQGNSFVVQKHAARRLHYDFRLELDGVLKSWAVTRGPSIDPADRRLAVHVEDHPLAYGTFEGTIPAGQYGGGTVMVWDYGSWDPVEDPHKTYAKGKLKFRLHGQHLKGGWTLVRMHGRAREEGRDNWLLIKERDAFARPGHGDALLEEVDKSALSRKTMEQLERSGGQWISNRAADRTPIARRKKQTPGRAQIAGSKRGKLQRFVPPQFATAVDRPPNGADWIHEIKLDGYRIYCRRDGSGTHFLTRRGQDWTERFQRLVGPIEALPAQELALDGEVVVLDDNGHSSFGALQEALSSDDQRRLTLFAFDLLCLDGYDLRGAALIDRKSALRELIEGGSGLSTIRYSDHIDAIGDEVFRKASEMGLEGVVSKMRDRPYRSGRSTDWVKSKAQARQEFVIIGFTHLKKGGPGIGALVVGYYEDDRLIYAGRVGTGFDHATSLDLRRRLEPLRVSEPLVEQVPREMRRGVQWVHPELVAEVEFLSWTRDDVLRQPSFEGLREDKAPKEVVREPTPSSRQTSHTASKDSNRKMPAPRKSRDNLVGGIAITHASRVIFPDLGITKLDVARYYEAVADVMIPYLRDRPLSLLRCPQGVSGTCFFQKHFGRGELSSLSRVSVQESKGKVEYVVPHGPRDLIELAQHGIVEIHPWGCRADDLERPDQLIFDLDPDPDVGWDQMVETALALKQNLEGLGLRSFAKTTGGKGLHLVIPLRRQATWPEVKEFARAFAGTVVEAAPSMFTANPLKRLRKGKIFVDYLRNDRGSTAVAPYAVRARAGATVAFPVPWPDVTKKLDPKRFTLRTVPALIAKRADPWREMAKVRQVITERARRAVGIDN